MHKRLEAISLRALRHMDGQEIIRRFGSETKRIFTRNKPAVPVIIPSRNEERDIPSCLAALARSDVPVLPIVVVNCSNDGTRERAEAMGALVVEINGVKKMGATQKGIATALEQAIWPDEHHIILFTDADTLVPKGWARIMSRHLRRSLDRLPGNGAAVYGSSIFLDGPSIAADLGQCVHAFVLDIWQFLKRASPLVRGHTYGLALDGAGRIVDTINAMDPVQMYRDDVTVYEGIRDQGVPIVRCLHPSAIVRTRGDRAHSFKELMQNLYEQGYEKSTYDKQYDLSACPDAKRTRGTA